MAVGVFGFNKNKKNSKMYKEHFVPTHLWLVESLDGKFLEEYVEESYEYAIKVAKEYTEDTGVPCVISEEKFVPFCYTGNEEDCDLSERDFW